ncbi:hypothetical protein A9Q84_00890 [Halobacteriovorax marinus]|uniref:Response regulatory domain-containing protein n=1 Tax=Halobacteriovorax marinus TaxID=97084 RepID=A0A1Y5FBW5_9BACT|nr:hypothetical protein A9Q84_00890 [Halobacteriovorax marinus]
MEERKLSDLYPHQILLVEDNIKNQKVAKRTFEKLGYSCDIVENGLQALDLIDSKSVGHYSIVFMDIQMPVMDGIAASKDLLVTYGSSRPRVVAMTANVFKEDKKKCREAGMEYFLSKPVDIKQLEDVLVKFYSRQNVA